MKNLKLLTISETPLLLNTVKTIQILVDEAQLKFRQDGLYVKAMDPSRVAMVDAFWSKTMFLEYEAKDIDVTLNLSELIKLLNRGHKGDAVTLELTEAGKLLVNIITEKGVTRNFSMPTLESSQEELPTPKIEFKVKTKLVLSELESAIDDTHLVANHCKIIAEKDKKMVFQAKGDLMSADVTLNENSILEYVNENEITTTSTYSLNYLTEMLKQLKTVTPSIELKFNKDMPLFVKNESDENAFNLTYYLAPRIETE